MSDVAVATAVGGIVEAVSFHNYDFGRKVVCYRPYYSVRRDTHAEFPCDHWESQPDAFLAATIALVRHIAEGR